jgi:hypothetical protein
VVDLLVDEGKRGMDEKQGGGSPFIGTTSWWRTRRHEHAATHTVSTQRQIGRVHAHAAGHSRGEQWQCGLDTTYRCL